MTLRVGNTMAIIAYATAIPKALVDPHLQAIGQSRSRKIFSLTALKRLVVQEPCKQALSQKRLDSNSYRGWVCRLNAARILELGDIMHVSMWPRLYKCCQTVLQSGRPMSSNQKRYLSALFEGCRPILGFQLGSYMHPTFLNGYLSIW